ncbi:exodeoxyribonuclease VII small subunit [Methanolobus sp.]|uniref:exodeoxyribonuclease VII small subunit n=1 Tax=Methanolobus sp. TaxID=1874737 RepID=UPI0025D6BC40|nr:exodeoxyribonuclease VII small subunit [Methanolobus sp.]
MVKGVSKDRNNKESTGDKDDVGNMDNKNQTDTRDREIDDDDTTFEESMDELEALVDRLERGQLLLDESLELFERGMKLARTCNGKLLKAERKIEMLIEENGKVRVSTFNEDG